LFKFSTSIAIDGDTIKDISFETEGVPSPRMAIRLESGSHIFIYATASQFQVIAQAVTDWRKNDDKKAS